MIVERYDAGTDSFPGMVAFSEEKKIAYSRNVPYMYSCGILVHSTLIDVELAFVAMTLLGAFPGAFWKGII